MTLSKKLNDDITALLNDFTEKNKDKTLKEIKQLVQKDKPKPRTETIRFSIIKKRFKEKTKDLDFLSNIRPEKAITQQIVEENTKIRDQRRLINIDEETIKKIMSFEKSSDMHELAIYLLFVSGRRVSELNESIFYNVKKTKLVQVKGLKKRTDSIDCQFMTLVPKTTFFKVLKKYKSLRKHSNKTTFHRTLNRRMKTYFPEKNYKPHTLRGFFITYSFTFRNKDQKKLNTFIQENLCHQSITASLNYTQYKMDSNFTKDIIRKNASHV